MRHFMLLKILFLVTLIHVSECRLSKRTFQIRRSKGGELATNQYANECAKFKYFTQIVDHFRVDNTLTYQQRYILSDSFVEKNASDSPIFFYTGNEGDIQWFCENTGFVWEIAEKFKALVVFAEHRYYGESLPYGKKSFDIPNIDYLTSEQALADFAYLITDLKSNKFYSKSPVIAFGGSYGGMLSAWIRQKYPNLVDGALAASAPVWQFVASCGSFSNVTSNAFKRADPNCPKLIASSWEVINKFGKTKDGLKKLKSIFRLCDTLTDVNSLKSWLNDIYVDTAMANYPYDNNFLSTLPAWPVKVMCSNITTNSKFNDDIRLLEAIYSGINVYQNYTGKEKCFQIMNESAGEVDEMAWSFQTCNEMVFPMCSDGVNDMFEPEKWDYELYRQNCYDQFKIYPRKEFAPIYYGASPNDIKAHSNIIFSNGDLDPWSSGGVLVPINSKINILMIENGAHHLDLRSSKSQDPKSVVKVRLEEMNIISNWIDEARIKKF